MTIKQKIIKDTSVYSGSTIISQLIIMSRGFVIARFLGPAIYGIWNALMVMLKYTSYSNFGLLQAMNKEIPFHRGTKNNDKVDIIKNSIFSFILFISLLIGTLVIISSFFLPYSPLFINGIRIVSLIIIAEQFYLFYMMLLRVNNKFSVISKGLLLFSVINLIFTLLLIFFNGLYGALTALLVSYILTIIYMMKKWEMKTKIIKDFEEIKYLLKIGFPLLLLGICGTAINTIDNLMVISLIGKTELGYYGLAFSIMGFILYAPNVISQVIFPRFSEKYGENKDVMHLKNYLSKTLSIISYLIPVLIGFVFILIHLPIQYFLPNYVPSIIIVKILIFGSFFMALTYTLRNFLITLNKYFKLLLIEIASIFLMILLIYYLIVSGYGIEGVAFGAIITYMFQNIVITGYSFKFYAKNFVDFLKMIIKLYLPIIYVSVVLYLINNFGIGLKLFTFSLLSLPLIYYVNKKTNIFYDVFEIIIVKLRI